VQQNAPGENVRVWRSSTDRSRRWHSPDLPMVRSPPQYRAPVIRVKATGGWLTVFLRVRHRPDEPLPLRYLAVRVHLPRIEIRWYRTSCQHDGGL
jgi:hypothetical protein